MKKPFLLTFVSIILMGGISFAQGPPIDFETVGNDWSWTVFDVGTGGGDSVITNPDPSGINTSANCGMLTIGADGNPWGGMWSDDIPDFTLDANNSIITVMVYKDTISRFNLKLENPGEAFGEDNFVSNTVTGQWELLTFDWSAYIGQTITRITIIPDQEDAFPRTYGSTNYFDNITFGPVTDIPVTFQCDMSVQVLEGNFDPGTGMLVIRGDFQDEAGDPGGDWQGDFFAMADANADTIYDLTVNFPPAENDSSFNFKFVISPDGWEALADNRAFTVMSPGVTLPVFWFSDDSIANVVPAVTNTLNFTADISGILGIGAGGAFDPAQDSIQIAGLDWDGLGKDVTGNRTLIQDPFNPGIFTTTLSVTSGGGFTEGDSTKWKFKAYPDSRFSNGGWETGEDRWHIYQMDGATITLPTIVPRIFPLFDTLANDINVTFNVDMSDPVNQYNGLHIDPATLEFVGMRGGAGFLGDWSAGGNWTPDDTTLGVMKVLTDMGNNMYSRTVFLPGGTQGGGVFEYKFAMMYPGADTVNGGSSPLDNEGGFGINHSFTLVDGPDIVLDNVFGNFVVSVEKVEDLIPAKYELEQNYPNPFNPSTTIRYSIPQEGLVTLRVFNLLGEEVATLVNEELVSGVYEVNFSANAFASGIYFYTLNVGDFAATKKMILLK